MKISIVMPAFNSEKFICNSIKSIIDQSYDNWELIIVNDGSTDKTVTLISEFSNIEPRINIINQSNQGPLKARLNGISNATGDYVMFIDADDTYVIDALDKIKSIAGIYNPDLILYNYSHVDSDDLITRTNKHKYSNDLDIREIDKKELLSDFIRTYDFNSLWSKAVKLDVLLKDIKYLDKIGRVLNAEDRIHSLKIINSSTKIVYIDLPLYNYRENKDSTTVKYNYSNLKDIIYIEEMVYNIIKNDSIYNGLISDYYNSCIYYITGSYLRFIMSNKLKRTEKKNILKSINESYLISLKYPLKFKNKLFKIMIKYRIHFIFDILSYINKKRIIKTR